ncbi:hypothetical protein HYC85_010805 [Camellia sinensis]|uniref:RRM domain-containing protein n=1 Tax=Camellia sinensis TaxID=4442 RepID=A0A7J7HKU9_CAMSI|nr:hypothetical protein HYC85_010805 [Camellia sinensis]
MVVPSGGDTESSGLGTDAEGGDNPKMEGSGFKLNPNAREWYPPPSDGTDEESRCLYITFSNGYPLSENQIYLFFSCMEFGRYVEKIYIHKPRDSVPLFGKITFKASFVPAAILNGRDQVRFTVFGRTIWCKKYNRSNRGR